MHTVFQAVDNPSYTEIRDVCVAAEMVIGVEVRFVCVCVCVCLACQHSNTYLTHSFGKQWIQNTV